MAHDSAQEDDVTRVKRRPWWHLWVDYHREVKHLVIDYSFRERERQISKIVDDGGFNTTVFFVAASGFLASSYSLFSMNVVTPSLFYLYPPNGRLSPGPGFVIDELTLIGTVLGMVVMGHLADRSGRKTWYGVELLILIIATMGVVQSSEGFMVQESGGTYKSSMDIYSWISWWRLILGFGIGAEYPLSSIICAEWASTESRGTMLSAVFLTQAIGRLLACAVSLGSLQVISKRWHVPPGSDSDDMKLVVDSVWRLTVGIGMIPAAVAVLLRLTIPETPRYYADIMKDLRMAVKNAMKIYGRNKDIKEKNRSYDTPVRRDSDEEDDWFGSAWNYLTGPQKAWKRLASISLLWCIMDIGFYGLSMDSPSALSTLAHDPSDNSTSYDFGWHAGTNDTMHGGGNQTEGDAPDSSWNTDYWNPNNTIYNMLEENAVRSILITTVASLAGSITAIVIINYFRRKYILFTTFLILSVLFAVAGANLIVTSDKNQAHLLTTIFIALIHFTFNAGPNTLIFVLAAEIFPTVYRCTFYGMAAASGKVGAIVIRAVIEATENHEKSLGIRLLVCIPLMLISAWISLYLPDVQTGPRLVYRDAEAEAQPLPESQLAAGTAQEETPTGHTTQPLPTGESLGDRDSVVSTDISSVNDAVTRTQPGLSPPRLRLLGRLKNIPLERIAPNPS
ncbi:Uu.00g061320.m01.CDS01 [Anthostomella pinea]|uniref:Uu.00g061320.m01.CDS01 n=1 Tax=Anthostomella pinea TaxID=933095 RepID=A0AAI8YMI0_9PEZI|nr:Uu.00g061320.m01.CDS01 [Anthostomella pinea]